MQSTFWPNLQLKNAVEEDTFNLLIRSICYMDERRHFPDRFKPADKVEKNILWTNNVCLAERRSKIIDISEYVECHFRVLREAEAFPRDRNELTGSFTTSLETLDQQIFRKLSSACLKVGHNPHPISIKDDSSKSTVTLPCYRNTLLVGIPSYFRFSSNFPSTFCSPSPDHGSYSKVHEPPCPTFHSDSSSPPLV